MEALGIPVWEGSCEGPCVKFKKCQIVCVEMQDIEGTKYVEYYRSLVAQNADYPPDGAARVNPTYQKVSLAGIQEGYKLEVQEDGTVLAQKYGVCGEDRGAPIVLQSGEPQDNTTDDASALAAALCGDLAALASLRGCLTQSPRLRLLKTTDTSGLSETPQAGDILLYTFEVQNVGDVPVFNLQLVEPNAVVTSGTIVSLAQGNSNTQGFTSEHTLTPADILAGGVHSQAFLTAQTTAGAQVFQVSDDADTVGELNDANDTNVLNLEVGCCAKLTEYFGAMQDGRLRFDEASSLFITV